MATIICWVVLWGSMAAIIRIDQGQRANQAKAQGLPDFQDKSIVPFLLMGLICGALILPVYFYTTRKNAIGVLIGLGWTVAAFALAFGVAFLLALAHIH